MTRKMRRSRPKQAKGRQLNLWVHHDTVAVLDLLTRKWSTEKKIASRSRSAALAYMVKNFGELARLSPSGGAILPLSPSRRDRLAFLGKAFETVGAAKDESELEAVGCMIDYLYGLFSDERFLDRFIDSRGQFRPA